MFIQNSQKTVILALFSKSLYFKPFASAKIPVVFSNSFRQLTSCDRTYLKNDFVFTRKKKRWIECILSSVVALTNVYVFVPQLCSSTLKDSNSKTFSSKPFLSISCFTIKTALYRIRTKRNPEFLFGRPLSNFSLGTNGIYGTSSSSILIWYQF